MAKKKNKKEALTVARFVKEILVEQLGIPFENIVNDTTFHKYTGSKRPDLLISNVAYDVTYSNDDAYVANLLAYAEAKDSCSVGDKDWLDAYEQAKQKAAKDKLNIPFFIVTNCKVSYFYNSQNGDELRLNGNPIREFPTLDVLRLIKKRLESNPAESNINTSADTQSAISEAVFNKKLWELANIYRSLDFKNISQKIDFTIGFISLKVFEEKAEQTNSKDKTKDYWSDLADDISNNKHERFLNNLSGYIARLESETEFKEFKELMEVVNQLVTAKDKTGKYTFPLTETVEIYKVIESMGVLHNSGFDLFGAVYEMFASNKEKSDFGEFFTRRHYTHIFAKLLLKGEKHFNKEKKFHVLDPACGTGGFLTEAFKILQGTYKSSDSYNKEAQNFLEKECFFGFDVKEENVSRSKLNMFLVGDGHTQITKKDTLKDELNEGKYDYIITNPPYGNGKEQAETSLFSTKRYEIAFLIKIVKLLKNGGKACVVIPDGFFENPSYEKARVELLEKCSIESIVSLPKFAFAPYTKEKTYAIFFEKRSKQKTKIQSDPIWMYIIDNDGYANSDKRFRTNKKDDSYRFLHDEISAWIDVDGVENVGILEHRWLRYQDETGTEWVDERGIKIQRNKAKWVEMKDVNSDNFYNLLPEYHLRPYEPKFITSSKFIEEVNSLNKEFKKLLEDL